VVFAGEVGDDHQPTAVGHIRSLAATEEVTKLDPAVGERLDRARVWLRRCGQRMTRKDAVSAADADRLDLLAEAGAGWRGLPAAP
jgi:hypothetical protein